MIGNLGGKLAPGAIYNSNRFTLRALQAEVKPLNDVSVGILADVDIDRGGACGADNVDGASVELAAEIGRAHV